MIWEAAEQCPLRPSLVLTVGGGGSGCREAVPSQETETWAAGGTRRSLPRMMKSVCVRGGLVLDSRQSEE